MIPISSPIRLGCGARFDELPVYCPNEIIIAGGSRQRCPGPVVQFFADEPAPQTLAEALECIA